jgi:rod shape-determining protein MreB and related proteins
MFKKIQALFSHDIGIDLGTANTLVYVKGYGILINEPSVVVLNQKTGQIVAVGKEAKEMLGRTPAHLKSVRPLVDGVISDFEVTEEMLAYLIGKVEKISKKFFRPRVLIGLPTGITNVESRAVYDAAKSAGARAVYLAEEPVLGALGIHMPVDEAVGSVVVDIGGGTTDIAVLSSGGVVRSKNVKIAGDTLNNAIITYLRDEFKLLVGEKTAEAVKIAIGSVVQKDFMEAEVRGRDLLTGLPREVIVTDTDVREAILPSVLHIVDAVREVLETTPPEILADVLKRGIVLVGGGALIQGLDTLLSESIGIPVYVAEDPLTAVARGTGVILENLEKYQDILIDAEYVVPKN